MPLAKALELAQEYDLDLVEVAATARPPVCKLMDYGKFKYESAMKAREARKNQAHTVIKEMKLRPKIDPHDYETKKGHVVRFLKQGDKVKITIMFRGREQSRPELGYRLLQRLAEDVADLGFVESNPKQDGRNMIMVLGPHKKKTEAMAEARQAQEARKAEAKANPGKSQNAAETEAPAEEPAEEPAEARLPGRQSQEATRYTTTLHRARFHDRAPERHPRGENGAMPKNKSHSGASKRFKITGSGKVLRERAGKRHLLEHKSSRVTRRLTGNAEMAPGDAAKIKKLLGK